ncbi:MAG: TolB family protein, partial [Chloroflexota bacterium]
GRRLAYTVRHAGRHDVWASLLDGSGAHPVTSAGLCRAPAWSPDGAWLAYLSAQGGTFDVWAVPAPAEAAGTVPPSGTPSPTAPTAPRQITKGGLLDAASGIAWTR